MTRSRHCPLENDYFDEDEFEVFGRTTVHMSSPPHRAVDGWPVETEPGGGVVTRDDGEVVLVRSPSVEPVGADADQPPDR